METREGDDDSAFQGRRAAGHNEGGTEIAIDILSSDMGTRCPSDDDGWITQRSFKDRFWRTVSWIGLLIIRILDKLTAGKSPKKVELPIGFEAQAATEREDLETLLTVLDSRKAIWAGVSHDLRAKVLRECRQNAMAVCTRAAKVAVEAHGSYGSGCGEELMGWVPVIKALKEYEGVMKGSSDRRPASIRKREAGLQWQYVADVLPKGFGNFFLSGVQGEIWMMPGRPPSQGRKFSERHKGSRRKIGTKRRDTREGRVAVVLGSGSKLPMIVLDVLHKLIMENEVVLLKMNRVNEFLGPYVASVLQPFIHRGFLAVCYGNTEAGMRLARHPIVDSVQVSGGEELYNWIVWGCRRTGVPMSTRPVITKPVTAALGNVTPIIVVPGDWSDKDLDHHADLVASSLASNSGHDCMSADILVMDVSWPLRLDFLERLRNRLKVMPQRVGWYPKTAERQAAFMRRFPDAEELGIHSKGSKVHTLPYLLVTGRTPDNFFGREENWTTALQEVAIPNVTNSPSNFLRSAIHFVNERCTGNLACMVIVDPRAQARLGSRFEKALADLKYGSITVNAPASLSFMATSLSWGAVPGNPQRNIVSGNAALHNTMMFDYPQKSVLRFPFQFPCTAFWSPGFGNLEDVAKRILKYLDHSSFTNGFKLLLALLRG